MPTGQHRCELPQSRPLIDRAALIVRAQHAASLSKNIVRHSSTSAQTERLPSPPTTCDIGVVVSAWSDEADARPARPETEAPSVMRSNWMVNCSASSRTYLPYHWGGGISFGR